MGRAAFFVRTFGCPVACTFCDSAGTWHPEHIPKDIARMTIEEIVAEATEKPVVEFTVITGGEPTVYNLEPLTSWLHGSRMPVHLETSGAFDIRGKFDWITLSPKKWKMPLESSVLQADEFKLIIESPEDIDYYVGFLERVWEPTRISVPVWLHPEWSHRKDPAVLNAISKKVVSEGGVFRAGWQIHKLYAVDLADNRSRQPVPLGGDVTKGF